MKIDPKTQKIIDFKTEQSKIVKVDLACGGSKMGPEWLGIDILPFPGVDIVMDLEDYPWPLPDGFASTILASHIIEHISPAKGGFLKWMNEAWRILKVGGEMLIGLPYGVSHGYVQDPTHCNPCNESTWWYFDPMHETGWFRFYHPKPWQIKYSTWHSSGNMEVALIKRQDDPIYYEDLVEGGHPTRS